VAEREVPTALRWLIGVELSAFRNRAGKTMADAAKHLGCSSGRLSHLETGRNQQQPKDIEALLRFYGASVSDVDRLATLARTVDDQTWFQPWVDVVPDWLHILVGLERLASKLSTYSANVFPAMLQTHEYSLAVTHGHIRVRPDHADRLANLRMERQRPLLLDAKPIELASFIEESVLDRPPTRHGENGGWVALRGQLEHALDVAARPNIEVRVVPTSAGAHPALAAGPFALLDFALAQSIGYVEVVDDAVYAHDRDQVHGYTRLVAQLQDVALSPADSLDALRARIARLP
jgi:transcriptional regulator with XRE-family HTH domain